MSSGSNDLNQYDSFIIHALDLDGDNLTNGWVVPSIDGWSWDGKSLTVLSPELSSVNHGINTSGAPLNGHLNKFEVIVSGNKYDYGISTDDSDAQFTVSAESIVVSATGHGIYGSTDENENKHRIEMTDFQTLVISGGNSGNGGAGIVINKRGEVLLHSDKANSQINGITSTRLYDHDAAISNKTAYDTTSDAVSKIDLKADTIIVNEDAGSQTGYNGIYS